MKTNRAFRRDYDQLFKKSPLAANTWLLLRELADEKGEVHLGILPEMELSRLMIARFENPRAYQLPGGPKG